jgi:predicted nucleic acid-binding protein
MIYLDASVVFPLYFRDCNTDKALVFVTAASESLVVSSLCEIETINAFALRVFRGDMSDRNMNVAIEDFESDLRSGILLWKAMPEAAMARSKELSRKITPSTGVRAADLLHIATALELGTSSMSTFDQKQRQAALAAGLAVNPLP